MQRRCRGFTDAQLNKHVPAQRSVGRTRRAIAQDEQRRAPLPPRALRDRARRTSMLSDAMNRGSRPSSRSGRLISVQASKLRHHWSVDRCQAFGPRLVQ